MSFFNTLKDNKFFKTSFKALSGTALRIFSIAVSLSFGIIATRLLGVEQFGVYVSLMSVAGLVTVAVSFGIPTLIMREVAAARGRSETGVIVALLDLSFLMLIIISMLTLILGLTYGVSVGLVLIFALLGNSNSLVGAVHLGRERVLFGSIVNDMIKPSASLLALGIFAFWGTTALEWTIIAQAIGVTFALVIFLKTIDSASRCTAVRSFRLIPVWSKEHSKYIRAGITLAGIQLLINLTTQIDILMLTAMTTPEDVAHYFAAARASLIVSFFFGISAAFAEPTLARLYAAGDHKGMNKVIGHTALMGFLFSVLAAGVAFLLSPTYFSFYGSTFLAADSSLHILLAGLIGWTLFGPAQVILRAAHQDKILFLITLYSVILNSFLSFLLIPRLGIEGAAIGTAAQFIFYGMAMAVVSRLKIKVRTDIFRKDVWKSIN